MEKPVHKGITPEKVLEAAMRVVEAEGASALTMRRLGAELGVVAMAVYNHFPDREAILDGVAEKALADLQIGRGGGWEQRLRRLIGAVHTLADQHPAVFSIIVDRPNRPQAFFGLMSEAMHIFAEAGLDRDASARWYHTFLILIHGYSTWRATVERFGRDVREGVVPALDTEQRRDWRAVHSISSKAQFNQTVDLLLKALENESRQALSQGR